MPQSSEIPPNQMLATQTHCTHYWQASANIHSDHYNVKNGVLRFFWNHINWNLFSYCFGKKKTDYINIINNFMYQMFI